MAGGAQIGEFRTSAQEMDGHIDEFRIQKGNYFNAAPASDDSDSITVPTEAYSPVAGAAVTDKMFMVMQ